jgi:hypothetical protein
VTAQSGLGAGPLGGGLQPPYGVQPQHTAQPQQGAQPLQGAEPPYGQQRYGQQQPYGTQPAYPGPQPAYPGPQPAYPGPQPAYPGPQSAYPGPPPQPPAYPGPQSAYRGPQQPQPPRGRPRTGMWLGIGGGAAVAIIVVVVVIFALASPGGRPSASATTPSASTTPAASATTQVPAACPEPAQSGGSGPWTVVQPQTICDLPLDTSAAELEANQELVSAVESDVSTSTLNGPSAGSYTSSVGAGYEYRPGTVKNVYRSVGFAALNGTFNVPAAMTSIESNYGITFQNLPPGPHGGMLACARLGGQPLCAFATSTTLCQFNIIDTTNELDANLAANALSIRDTIETKA